jgi:hypothetical protein
VRLKLNLLIFHGCLNPRYTPIHVFNCQNLLYYVPNPRFFTSLREISIHMIFATTPTLNRLLPCYLPYYLSHYGILGIWLSLHSVSEKWWLSPLFPLFHLAFHLVFSILLEIWSSLLLIIKIFSMPYGFLQCLGVIILYLVTDK